MKSKYKTPPRKKIIKPVVKKPKPPVPPKKVPVDDL